MVYKALHCLLTVNYQWALRSVYASLGDIYVFKIYIVWPLYGFIDRTASEMTRSRVREGGDTQQRAPGRETVLRPLQQG